MVTAASYPEWCERKLWTIRESVCLVLEVEPETPWLKGSHEVALLVGGIDPLIEAFEQYCELAVDAMKDGLLVPFSPWDFTRPPLDRRVIPRSFLVWAQSQNINVPEEMLSLLAREPAAAEAPSLMEHIGRGLVGRSPASPPSGEAREQVLGAALAALRSFPERCGSASGIRQVIEDNAPLIWAENHAAPLPADEIERLVSDWLNRLG